MRLHTLFRPRQIVIAAGLLLASLIAWAMFERASCRATLAKFEAIQRGQTRGDVHKMLGSPRNDWTGADVLHKLYWGSDVAIGQNEGRVVQEERYTHSGVWCSYLIIIGYAADGSVQSKFIYV